MTTLIRRSLSQSKLLMQLSGSELLMRIRQMPYTLACARRSDFIAPASNAVERLSSRLDMLQRILPSPYLRILRNRIPQPHMYLTCLTSLDLFEYYFRRSLMRWSLISSDIIIGEGKGNLRRGKVAFSICSSDRVYDSSCRQQ